jgi:hypothetical protein
LKVVRYNIPPGEGRFAANLLANADWRAALADKIVEDGPEVSVIVHCFLLARRTERLARQARGPYRSVVFPTGATQRARPARDTGEPVNLRKFVQPVGFDIDDATAIDYPRRDVARSDKVFQPVRGVWIDFIV